MEHIVFLDRDTIPDHIALPSPEFAHQWTQYSSTRPEQVIERLRDATIAITNKVVLDAAILAQLPKLKMIAIAATGTNNVDLAYCRQQGITVSNIRGYAIDSVPEHAVAMMFALRRNLLGYHRDIQQGVWQEKKQFCFFTHPIGDIRGATLGLIGSGGLGQAMAALGRALGMKVIFAERKGAEACREGYLPFHTVLAQADVLSLHCPLTNETRNLIGSGELEQMKDSAILINTGRGGLVDEQALVDALRCGEIAGAGCDVFTEEPADDDNPLIANSDLPNLLLTPHVAWGSDSAIQALANQLVDNLNAFAAGIPQNQV
ncbi:D-2-hydroxyacid dehydrogenase [Photobacterium gaetbulicola]|uniref:D-lactate dehydrogenase n=1 Tax=Photobacterium gaetbulicola Gung47 TaxID=658445 RepID=A0A0C5X3M1_9GAMM|nr:D-2-hydroxyacid dehydrogenase [Photobacterium gaetbulicola]AJR10000.1 D-lactate dehydrogenase [Photobacterium gaetbulicola Gung47]PSU05833.1 D-2-hydroxyacid dehydrogenase [Photobacterium gaetbulicola]